jgi:hypothetical protein
MGTSKTSRYYASNPKAAEKRREYQRKRNKTKANKEYRAECNSARKKLGLKKGDGMDASHTKSGKIVAEKRSANRARNGSGGKAKKK